MKTPIVRKEIYSGLVQLGFLVTISVALATTNDVSNQIFRDIRLISLSLTVIFLIPILLSNGLSRNTATSMCLFAVGLAWVAVLSVVTGAAKIGYENFIMDTGIVFIGLASLIRFNEIAIKKSVANWFLLYIIILLVLTYLVGGVTIDFPPRFSFEYASYNQGAVTEYGQSLSFIYGMGAVSASFLWLNEDKTFYKLIYSALSILLLGFSFVAGSRGEPVFAVIIVGAMYLVRAPRQTLIAIVVLLLISIFIIDNWNWLDDLVFISRMLDVTGGDYGLRDTLFTQGIYILTQDIGCFTVGCGAGFFQMFYGYESSLYPHNVLIESIITIGLPCTTIIIALSTFGLYIHWIKTQGKDLFIFLYAYHFMLSMKSGYLFGSWILIIGTLYFTSVFLNYGFRRSKSQVSK